jgi:3-carboxy-cis,cis-muconate cycloisomerase
MSFSPFDSPLYRDLFGDSEMARLFSDTGEVRAMMLVLGALARAQGRSGVIPEVSGAFLHRATMEVQIDPAGLSAGTGHNGVTVPGLVAAMRTALNAPEHAGYLHWGATSQDIQDTGLMLRLRQGFALIEARLIEALRDLADLAEAQAATPMAARTYGQVATPTSFGAMVAGWGWPILRALERIRLQMGTGFPVSLTGAAGTSSMLGPDPASIRAAMAEALDLRDPGHSWHAERSAVAEMAGLLGAVTTAGGKMGEDLMILTRSDVGEAALAGGGASSTMPQKNNPVQPSVLVALSGYAAAQVGLLSGLAPREARDGAAWFTEWLSLPQLVAAAGVSARLIRDLSGSITPDRAAMAGRVSDPLGLIQAEAISFALAAHMPRPAAQAEVKAMALRARDTGTPLPDLVAAAHPDLSLPDPMDMGQAPAEARAFARSARAAT